MSLQKKTSLFLHMQRIKDIIDKVKIARCESQCFKIRKQILALPTHQPRVSNYRKFLDIKFLECMVSLLFSADFISKTQPTTDKRVAIVLF
jgi:hypothetical protein